MSLPVFPPCEASSLADHILKAWTDMRTPTIGRRIQRNAQHEFYVRKVQPILEMILSSRTIPIGFLLQPIDNWNNMCALSVTIKIIDQMFFSGDLGYQIEVGLVHLPPDRRAQCAMVGYRNGKPFMRISIDYRKSTTELLFRRSLVHEMLHAYVMLHQYTCGGRFCIANSIKLRHCGTTGHGWYWQCLAEAAEILLHELWGLPIDIGRKESALMELLAGEGCEAIPFLCGCFTPGVSGHLLAQWKELEEARLVWKDREIPVRKYPRVPDNGDIISDETQLLTMLPPESASTRRVSESAIDDSETQDRDARSDVVGGPDNLQAPRIWNA